MIKKFSIKILLILSVVFLFTVTIKPLLKVSLVTLAMASGGSGHNDSHKSSSHDGGHEKSDSGKHGGGHAAAKRGDHHAAESWWRFTGWQGLFAVIACFYFAMVLMWLPKLVAKEVDGGHH